MRLLIDRAIAPAVARRLREVGRDAVSVAELGPDTPGDDAALLELAARDGRLLVTHNAGDVLPILAGRDDGPGAILVSAVRYPRTPLCVDRVVRALDAAHGDVGDQALERAGVHWLEPPAGCPFAPPPARE
jgi:hypothetical protein